MWESDEYYENVWSSEGAWTYLSLCCEPTLYEGLKFARDIILPNILLRLTLQFTNLPYCIRHSLSFIIGSFLLIHNVGSAFIWTINLAVGAYFTIAILSYYTRKIKGLLISVCVITFLLVCEIYIVNPKLWQKIRGIQMIAAMKIISLAVDLDRELYKSIPTPLEFAGYLICPANCILGPWISFQAYHSNLESKFLSRKWLKILISNMVLAIIFLILSNCIVPWYIDDEYKWLSAYRDAQSFRMSHYFVSTMSIVSMTSAGFGLTNDCYSEIEITKPYFIEIPRSLVQVVVYWNVPMHKWLKNYVFKSCRVYGQFTAIFVTYAVSSLLHGLNFQLSAVLLSIGTFSYVEYNFRHKIASTFEVCCLANPCTKCDHKFKTNTFFAMLLNSVFSFITIVHLAYLGVMFEASFSVQESGYSFRHTLSKWENLDFFSHWFVAFCYLINLMI